MAKTTLGVIISTRAFFPASLVPEARAAITAALKAAGVKGLMLSVGDTRLGAVETRADAKVCADLFKKHREELSGIVVVLPNFGDERGVAEAIRMSGLDVPVLIQAYPDDPAESGVHKRRDAFCGKISVCNNLVQQGTRFTLTTGHTVRPEAKTFEADLQDFVAVCRVVRGLRTARIGAIGARPAAFRTVRYSEKVLEGQGITVETLDLSELFGWAEALADKDRRVIRRANAFRKYADCTGVPRDKIVRMAKLAVVVDDWVKGNDLDATAIQCWTTLQENYGVASCALMSMMSEGLKPSACEVDVTGALSMYALTLASGGPAGLADWNNNYQDDPDKCVFFHCGNWPRSLCVSARIGALDIVGKVMGEERSWGSIVGRAAEGPLTFVRLSTDESSGEVVGYVGEGEFTNDPLETFGAYGVVTVQNLQSLMRMICRAGFEHHVAFSRSFVADIMHEALGNYLGWSIYAHSQGAVAAESIARDALFGGPIMLQCAECEFADIGQHGEVRLRCNPFINVKEPECLEKWQLMKLEALVQAYGATLQQYRRLAPLQEKMMKYMEHEIDDISEADKWKADWGDEQGQDESDDKPGDGDEPDPGDRTR